MQSETHAVISVIEPVHEPEIHKIWEARLGSRREKIWQWLTHAYGYSTPTQGFIATHNGKGIGFIITTYGGPSYINEYVGCEDMDINDYANTDCIGVCDTIAIQSEYENQGVGTMLLKHGLHHLQTRGVTEVVGMSWDRRKETDARVLFRKRGFQEIYSNPTFYSSIGTDVACPDCDDQCRCGATVFHRKQNSVPCPQTSIEVSSPTITPLAE